VATPADKAALALFVHAPTAAPSRGRVRSPLNARWSWPERHRWAKQWREATQRAAWAWWASAESRLVVLSLGGGPIRVHLAVRRHGRPLDADNLQSAVKPIRDELAKILGVDDAESLGHQWEVIEIRGQPPGIAVTIRPATPAEAAPR
jgi:hypothetical protein